MAATHRRHGMTEPEPVISGNAFPVPGLVDCDVQNGRPRNEQSEPEPRPAGPNSRPAKPEPQSETWPAARRWAEARPAAAGSGAPRAPRAPGPIAEIASRRRRRRSSETSSGKVPPRGGAFLFARACLARIEASGAPRTQKVQVSSSGGLAVKVNKGFKLPAAFSAR
jgi:hypothetical protein